jgi:hypothetical protein
MPARTALVSMLVGLLLAVPAMGQEAERYRLERIEGGFVRMDTATGQMSICREQDDQLVCHAAIDATEADRSQLDALEARIEALEHSLAELERRSLLRPDMTLPGEEDFEESLTRMEQFFRRFLGLIRELEEEPAPDRT